MFFTQFDELCDEIQKIALLLSALPVMPAQLIILAIGIVIAELSACDLVAAADHWHALGEQKRCQKVPNLATTRPEYSRILGWSFSPHVPGVVVVGPVLIVFPICDVVLVVVAHQVMQGKTVMRGDEVDGGIRLAAVVLVEIAAARDAVSEV